MVIDTTSRLQVVGSDPLTESDFFSHERKTLLPGGQLQYSLLRTVCVGGGVLELATGLPARIVSSAFTE